MTGPGPVGPPPTPGPVRKWWLGARPRTLPAALVPVVVGTAAAHPLHHVGVVVAQILDPNHSLAIAVGNGATVTTTPPGPSAYASTVIIHFPQGSPAGFWWRALGALVVALAIQIGTNYANDYSDGIRGTDDVRVGPVRLTATGLASPSAVRRAALAAFGVAAVVGLALAWATSWWILLVGAACFLAGWFYTGGPRPYGYAGLGEVFVFVFFGLVATVGTFYVETLRLDRWQVWVAAVMVGLLATALLLANNLRDIATDSQSGKKTLAVRVGRRRAAWCYVACVALPFVGVVVWGTPRRDLFHHHVVARVDVPAAAGCTPRRGPGAARARRCRRSGPPAGTGGHRTPAAGVRGDTGPGPVADVAGPGIGGRRTGGSGRLTTVPMAVVPRAVRRRSVVAVRRQEPPHHPGDLTGFAAGGARARHRRSPPSRRSHRCRRPGVGRGR